MLQQTETKSDVGIDDFHSKMEEREFDPIFRPAGIVLGVKIIQKWNQLPQMHTIRAYPHFVPNSFFSSFQVLRDHSYLQNPSEPHLVGQTMSHLTRSRQCKWGGDWYSSCPCIAHIGWSELCTSNQSINQLISQSISRIPTFVLTSVHWFCPIFCHQDSFASVSRFR